MNKIKPIKNEEDEIDGMFYVQRWIRKKESKLCCRFRKTIIIIKDVPAKVCNNCGEKFYDDETAKNIEKIVNQLKELTVEVTVVKYKEKIA